MLLDPAEWLYNLMGLTPISTNFKIFLIVLALGGFLCSYTAEKYLFPPLAKLIARLKKTLRPNNPKKRKEYKLIQESMRF